MGKGHYRGGGTLIGFGRVSNAKGRTSGVGSSGAALREQRRKAEKKKRAAIAKKIAINVKLARKLGKLWEEEKNRALYEKLARDQRAKRSSLAAALHDALANKTPERGS